MTKLNIKPDKENKLFISLSISNYALIFLFIVAAFFIGIGAYAYSSIEQARSNIHDSKYLAADEELNQSVSYLIKTMSVISIQISDWDEIFQQLRNPAYYSYWREHRLLSADIMPDYITSAEVYDHSGKVLAELSGSLFPPNIDVNSLAPSLDVRDEVTSLVLYYPVKRGADNVIEGYLGLRLPFIDSLISHYSFRYIDTDTLLRTGAGDRIIPLSDAAIILSYELKSSPEADTMMQILKNTVLQLASIIGVLCLMFYFLMVYLLGKPLLEISEYIDKLIQSNPGSLTGGVHSMFPVSELEKIKSSLNKYQLDLEKANSDLDEKNQELWVLAQHDSLTGVLNRRAFELEWNNSKQLLMRRRVGVCMMLFDINHFKAINDTYGHKVGDDVLVDISSCIQKALRTSEKLYRIGGDEFAVIIIGDTAEGELVLAQRCIDLVQK
ncbi:MAG: GGDEF domain-containing protein, partial [Proteobacteria bacterium]|nr:GGDEF domain-containing protein [Pseudomonadota bacterium]